MDEQHVPSNALEVLDPLEQHTLNSVIQRATQGAGLTPWEEHAIGWRARKERGKLILELIKLEAQTVIAEAIVGSEGRVEAAKERRALATFAEQLRSLRQAGELRDDALNAAAQLSEDSREPVQAAMDRVTTRYLQRVEKRAGREV